MTALPSGRGRFSRQALSRPGHGATPRATDAAARHYLDAAVHRRADAAMRHNPAPARAPFSPKALPTRAARSPFALGALLLCLLLGCCLPARAAVSPVPPTPAAPHMALLPYLDAFLDPTGSMDVDEVTAPANSAAFRPLALQAQPRTTGVLWLRFTLAPLPAGLRPTTLLLDLGPTVPAGPILYTPHIDPLTENTDWRETTPSQRNVLLLPEATSQPQTCYLRLDGLPGPWFAPTLRTPQDAANNWDSLAGTAAVLALGVVLLLCLLRGLSEKGQWRGWTALYVGVALTQAVLGMPAYGEGRITPTEAAAVLSPGLALMLLPHVGRHLLRTRGRSRALDVQFLLLSLPGAALALLPLLPGFGWLVRYLALWPAGTLLFVPTALAGALMGFGGARRFLLGCLVPPLFVAAGILGLDHGYAASLLAAAPLWGTALSALLIAGTGQPKDMAAAQAKSSPAMDPLALVPDAANASGLTATERSTDVITLDQPLDDPNLRLLPSLDPTPAAGLADDLSALPDGSAWTPPTAVAPAQTRPAAPPAPGDAADKEALRSPLEKILREGAALLGCALPPAVRQHAENLRAAADDLARALENPGALRPTSADAPPTRVTFNLQHLVREAHDAVSATAENAGIGLAWYLPPLLGHMYEGPGQALREVLGGLLESAVRATAHGAVHLTVRRVPESADPGHLLFTVTDTGAGLPPRSRSGQALLHAWELAGACNGYLTVDSGPKGASIAFTLRLTPLEGEEEKTKDAGEAAPQTKNDAAFAAPTVTVVGADAQEREMLDQLCREQGCRCVMAPDLEEALRGNATSPAVLLTVLHPLHGPAQADLLGRFEVDARHAGLSVFKALAVTQNQKHWDDLAETGYTHALLTPLASSAFAATLREALDEAGLTPDRNADDQDPSANREPAPLPDLFGPPPAATATARETVPTPDAVPAVAATQEAARKPEFPAASAPKSEDNGPMVLPLPGLKPETPTTRTQDVPNPAEATPDAGMQLDASSPETPPQPTPAAPEVTTPENAAPVAEASTEPGTPDIAAPDQFMPVQPEPGQAAPDQTAADQPAPDQAAADRPLPDLFGPDPFGSAPSGATPAAAEPAPTTEPTPTPEPTSTDQQYAALSERSDSGHCGSAASAPHAPLTPTEPETAAPTDATSTAVPGTAAATAAGDANVAEAPAPQSVAPQPTADATDGTPDVVEPQDEFLVSAGLGGPLWEEPSVSVATAGALLAQRPGEAVLTPVGAAGPETPLPAPESTSLATADQPPQPTATSLEPMPEAAPAPTREAPASAGPQDSAHSEPQAGPKPAPPDQTPEATAPQKTAPAPAAQPHGNVAAFATPSLKEPAAPTTDAAPAAARAMPGPAGWVSYDLSDEWVGEPMPIGTPLNAGRPQAADPVATPAAAPAPDAPTATPTRDHRHYVSPSISTAGEWVGEPMPISKKPVDASTAELTPPPTSPQPVPAQPSAPRQPARVTVTAQTTPRPTPSTADRAAPPLTATGRPEPQAVFTPTREMPHTAAGRLILKLLGGLDRPAPDAPLPQPAIDTPPRPAERATTPEASIMNFIAGASASSDTPAGETAAPATAPHDTRTTLQSAPLGPQSSPKPGPQAVTPPPAAHMPPQEDATLLRLVERLDAAMEDAQNGYRNRRCPMVGEAAARIAAESDAFGFRVLARMARCVERAARANDMNALHDLLPELTVAVERNRIALNPRRQNGG